MVMESQNIPQTTPLPGIIKILGEGFNLAASKIRLMIAPIILDLFLLFGPKLRISDYVQPILDSAANQMISSNLSIGTAQLELSLDLIGQTLKSVNLFGLLQTYPIGIPGLLAASGSTAPLGKTVEIQMNSFLLILLIMLIMFSGGIILGTIYHSAIASAVRNRRISVHGFFKQLLNVILLYISLIIVSVVLSIPCSCLMTLGLMISPFLYQIFMLLILMALCWLIIPLFYIPHGIFVKNLDFPQAVRASIQLASWSGSITIRFILLSVILTMGLDMIWTIPAQSSWLILFSIFGHAFISTAMFAASFILYQELEKWQAENRAFLEWRKANLHFRHFIKKETDNNDR